MFTVMKERCGECLYGPNKIVSNARRREILQEVHARDGYFVCHKASLVGKTACCHGNWESHGGGQLGRIAGRLGAVQFVTEFDLTATTVTV